MVDPAASSQVDSNQFQRRKDHSSIVQWLVCSLDLFVTFSSRSSWRHLKGTWVTSTYLFKCFHIALSYCHDKMGEYQPSSHTKQLQSGIRHLI